MKKLASISINAFGIVKMSDFPNSNGSVTCLVKLNTISLDNNSGNFREYAKGHTAQLMANYNSKAVRNPILCTYIGEQGSLTTIDGRHTLNMLLSKGVAEWTCDIFFNITRKDASSIFHELTQNNRRMGVWDAFAAAKQAGYSYAMDISDALIANGFSTPKDQGKNRVTADFRNALPLKQAQEKGRPFLDLFLAVMQGWYNVQTASGTAFQASASEDLFQKGLVQYLASVQGKARSEVQLISKLRKISAQQITEAAIKIAPKHRLQISHFKQAFEQLAA